jgi:hypothetical protein
MVPTANRLRRHLALLHPERPAVALRATPGGGRLVGHEGAWAPLSEVEGLGYAASPLGTLAALLGCVGEADREEGGGDRLYLAEVMPGAPMPDGPDLLWWEADDRPPLDLPEALHGAFAAALVAATSAGAAWPPYLRRGGTAALAASLAEADLGVSAAIDARARRRLWQVRIWSLSSVWMNDHVVMKATLPIWRGEGPVTAHLAEVAPGLVPRVYGHGDVDGSPWSLQERLVGRMPSDDLVSRSRLAATLGALQRRTMDEADTLLACGAPLLDAAALARALSELWSSEELATLGAEEREGLQALDARLRERLRMIEALEPRPTLVHGDLTLGNALVGDEGIAFIDWTDAALSFPGVDLLPLIGLREDPRDPLWAPVLDAYRAGFGLAWGPDDEAVLALALEVAPVYHALAYDRIRRALPPELRWELSGVVRFLVRVLLERFGG